MAGGEVAPSGSALSNRGSGDVADGTTTPSLGSVSSWNGREFGLERVEA